MESPGAPRWFLSFDCATKTFGFSICFVDLAGIRDALPRRAAQLAAARELQRRGLPFPRIPGLGGFFRIADGDTVDLAPGVPDAALSTVARIRALRAYCETRVDAAVARARAGRAAPLRVLVEYQMGANAPARQVSAALVALYAKEDVALVAPSLKNAVACSPAGRYSEFAPRFASAYGANKAQAAFNFATLEKAFGSGVDPALPPRLRGHVADSVMQVWGHLIPGAERCDAF